MKEELKKKAEESLVEYFKEQNTYNQNDFKMGKVHYERKLFFTGFFKGIEEAEESFKELIKNKKRLYANSINADVFNVLTELEEELKN